MGYELGERCEVECAGKRQKTSTWVVRGGGKWKIYICDEGMAGWREVVSTLR